MSEVSKNRNPIKRWEVTFPQIGNAHNMVYTKEDFHEAFPESSYHITALEHHEDGGEHFHTGLQLVKGITKSNMLKILKNKWPEDWIRIHVAPIRSWTAWHAYCHKEDKNPHEEGEQPFKKKT